MASRFYSDVRPIKEAKPSHAGPKEGPKKEPVKERTAGWPQPGPYWKSSFNRTSKMPVVKTRAAKRGIA